MKIYKERPFDKAAKQWLDIILIPYLIISVFKLCRITAQREERIYRRKIDREFAKHEQRP